LGIRLGINLLEILKFPLKNDAKELQICVGFLDNRVLSNPLPYSSSIRILQKLIFPISTSLQNLGSLLKLKTPLRFSLIEFDPKTGDRNILSVKDIEWRYILVHERLNLNIELDALKHKAGGSLGILKLEVVVEKV